MQHLNSQRLKILNDFIFKKLFGEHNTKRNLVALLKAILKPQEWDHLNAIAIVNNQTLTGAKIKDKDSILDIQAKTKIGTKINIEIQQKNEYNMPKRALFYSSKVNYQ